MIPESALALLECRRVSHRSARSLFFFFFFFLLASPFAPPPFFRCRTFAWHATHAVVSICALRIVSRWLDCALRALLFCASCSAAPVALFADFISFRPRSPHLTLVSPRLKCSFLRRQGLRDATPKCTFSDAGSEGRTRRGGGGRSGEMWQTGEDRARVRCDDATVAR